MVDMSGQKSSASGFLVIGNHERANIKPYHRNYFSRNKYLRKAMHDIFPAGHKYANAALLCHDPSKNLSMLTRKVNRYEGLSSEDIDTIGSSLVDMVVYAREGAYTRCSLFKEIFPDYEEFNFVLRDFDKAGKTDMSLNYCLSLIFTVYAPMSPSRFKLGIPSPGEPNDCSGSHWYVEQYLYGHHEVSDQTCSTSYSSDGPYLRLHKPVKIQNAVNNRDTMITNARGQKRLSYDKKILYCSSGSNGDDWATTSTSTEETNTTTQRSVLYQQPASSRMRLSLKDKLTIVYVHQFFQKVKDGSDSQSRKPEVETEVTGTNLKEAISLFRPTVLFGANLSKPNESLSWSCLGGMDDHRAVLSKLVIWPLQYPNLFAKVPVRIPKGALLYGPPGCGKTLLAGVIASESKCHYIAIKGPELLSKYIGASEESVRNTFERARSAKPCLLFFDEFDALAPRRGHDSTGVTDRVVNQLLTELDGVEDLKGVFVLASTSRPDLIDPALLRPGRFDQLMFCDFPTTPERLEILNCFSKTLTFVDEIDTEQIAKATDNFSGADLRALLNTAQTSAIQELIDSGTLNEVSAGLRSNGEKSVGVPLSWKHVLDALSESHPALSKRERMRFHRIYTAFQDKRKSVLESIGDRVSLA